MKMSVDDPLGFAGLKRTNLGLKLQLTREFKAVIDGLKRTNLGLK